MKNIVDYFVFFDYKMVVVERWPSGRRRTAGIRVYGSAVPRVRIPFSLLYSTPQWAVRPQARHPVRPGREQRTKSKVCAVH